MHQLSAGTCSLHTSAVLVLDAGLAVNSCVSRAHTNTAAMSRHLASYSVPVCAGYTTGCGAPFYLGLAAAGSQLAWQVCLHAATGPLLNMLNSPYGSLSVELSIWPMQSVCMIALSLLVLSIPCAVCQMQR
jgi:hypothetical protein